MALIDYMGMGDSPGFMSYQRQPLAQFSGLPKFTQPPKPAATAGPDFGDLVGNPGDKQHQYNIEQAYQSGFQEIVKDYGGEIGFAKGDERFQELNNLLKWQIFDREAADQNKKTSDNYEGLLRNKDSGQNPSDWSMQMDIQTGLFTPKTVGNGIPLSKGDELSYVKNVPQLIQREDGSTGINRISFDENTGSQSDFVGFMNETLAHLGETAGGYTETRGSSASGALSNWAMTTMSGNDWSNNKNQVDAVINYLNNNPEGFTDKTKYYLAQSFMNKLRDEGVESFDINEATGESLMDTKGKPKTKLYTMNEVLSNPNLYYTTFRKYQADMVTQFVEKARKNKFVSETSSDFENIDPSTGGVIPQEKATEWDAVHEGYVPPNTQSESIEEVILPDSAEGYYEDAQGNLLNEDGEKIDISAAGGKLKIHSNRRTINRNVMSKESWERMENDMLNGNFGEIGVNSVMVGGLLQKLNADQKQKLRGNSVESLVEGAPMMFNPDGTKRNLKQSEVKRINEIKKNSKLTPEAKDKALRSMGYAGTKWLAKMTIVHNEDEDLGFNYWSQRDNKIKPLQISSGLFDTEYYPDDEATKTGTAGRGITTTINPYELPKDKVARMVGTSKKGNLFTSNDKAYSTVIYVDVTEKMPNWDRAAKSSTIRNQAEYKRVEDLKIATQKKQAEKAKKKTVGINLSTNPKK